MQPAGVGLGYRREFQTTFRETSPALDFVEIAPENWMGIGGSRLRELEWLADNYTLVCHGLSLSLGGPDPLDMELLKEVRTFMLRYEIATYSEHLSFCCDNGHLHELLPMPFTQEAADYFGQRIGIVQDFLEQAISVENISYYTKLATDLSELEFINAVIQQSGCKLLLDVNNLYVNSQTHNYCPNAFLQGLADNSIAYIHIAGHENFDDGTLVDTHGTAISKPVWELLNTAYSQFGPLPTLLERDNAIPALPVLMDEIDVIRNYQAVDHNA